MTVRKLPSLMGDINMLVPIESLGLAARTENALWTEGLYHIGQLLTKTEGQLLMLPNIGARQIRDITARLNLRGYEVGEAAQYSEGMEYIRVHNLRTVYGIDKTLLATREWTQHPERRPIFNHEEAPEINDFAAKLSVNVPVDVIDAAKLKAIQGLCQRAFELGVQNKLHNAMYPDQQRSLKEAIQAEFGFNAAADNAMRDNCMQGFVVEVGVSLPSKARTLFNPRVLRDVANSLQKTELTGFVVHLLQSSEGPQ